ncbi:FliO/MopB family protein [Luteithermobacter gelatinilyticus]|uniref:FliO/MopB family protein n=1 Tax=Luteithermobacter gelatinilyticus TaxID=2582913 RepID=UPI001105AB20|nr:flagellar biosynthetic protein FliO [Luteithermobacter gelatinilyticus]
MDIAAYIQFIIALLFVIGLILLLAYGAKRLGLAARVTINSPKAQERRLNIVEVLTVDSKRRLMLIRRDNVEHLIMLGVEKDLVIEQNIPCESGLDSSAKAIKETIKKSSTKIRQTS